MLYSVIVVAPENEGITTTKSFMTLIRGRPECVLPSEWGRKTETSFEITEIKLSEFKIAGFPSEI